MKLNIFQRGLQVVTRLQFAIFLLGLLAFLSSLGSIIEQDETLAFYQEHYPLFKPLYGIFTWKILVFFGLNQVYTTWWFQALLFLLALSLICCTFTKQFPLLANAKKTRFSLNKRSFLTLPFFVRFPNLYYTSEHVIQQLQKTHFVLYQKQNIIYAVKGIVGRLSPIFVHISLLFILTGAFFSAFFHLKVEEVVPKGEIFHLQNPLQIGTFTSLPSSTLRVNDFWVEYRFTFLIVLNSK